MTFVLNHLWQSTLFGAVVALLALALKENAARWRCHLWLAASLKFAVPFAALAAMGSRFGWRTPHVLFSQQWLFMGSGEPLMPPPLPAAASAASGSVANVQGILLVVWLAGFAAALFRWWLSRRRVSLAVRAAVPIEAGRELEALRRVERIAGIGRPIPMLASAERLEPGIVNAFHPVLLWPAGMGAHLDDAQLEAILAHEVCHVRRRDNLMAALHMLVESVFWFHPLLWWLRARLIDERERACDEEVLHMGSRPEAYADGILKACRFYLEAPQMCMAGVTGSDLKQRIERIMARRAGRPLDFGRKLLLAVAGFSAIAGPILFGMAHAPAARAQSQPAAAPAFEVASIKPNKSDDRRTMFNIGEGGRVSCTNISPKMLIMMAYDLKPNQLTGAPSWVESERYDITAKAEGPAEPDQLKLMMRSLLADRFKLVIHRETKDLPIYELVTAKGGPKLKPAADAGAQNQLQMMRRGQMELQSASMAQLAQSLSSVVGRNVYDKTGLTGTYDMKLEWTPDESENAIKGPPPPDGKENSAPAPESGPSLLIAIQEQLGLKLMPSKGPVDLVVIDHIDRASEN
jgi:bla regulator protein blaR1